MSIIEWNLSDQNHRGTDMQEVLESSAAPIEKNHADEINAIAAMARVARNDALRLGLKFEAYLLDMAIVALNEQSYK